MRKPPINQNPSPAILTTLRSSTSNEAPIEIANLLKGVGQGKKYYDY
jgi:hypothetical protein